MVEIYTMTFSKMKSLSVSFFVTLITNRDIDCAGIIIYTVIAAAEYIFGGIYMNFDFGENIKTLRKQKGLTQEQVAELLDVSKQSVSRWENNATYPDITFLPILASFYNVTVDFLLGADYETNKSIIEDYEKSRQEAHHHGNISDAYSLSQKVYASFPNNKSIINNVMVDSYLMGLHNVDNKRKYYLEMSISIAERFLKMTDDLEEQCRCIKNISVCNKLLGNHEKSIEWMKKLPSIWSGIETAALGVLEGKDKIDSIQCSLDAVLHLLHRLIFVYATESELPKQDRIKALEKLPHIFEIVFEDEDFGFYHTFLSRVFVELAKLSEENRQQTIVYAKKAVEHAKLYDSLTSQMHTSLLFKGQRISPEEYTSANNQTQTERVAAQLSGDINKAILN